MTYLEQVLVQCLNDMTSREAQVILLQSFIQKLGPLTEETAAEVRKILSEKKP